MNLNGEASGDDLDMKQHELDEILARLDEMAARDDVTTVRDGDKTVYIVPVLSLSESPAPSGATVPKMALVPVEEEGDKGFWRRALGEITFRQLAAGAAAASTALLLSTRIGIAGSLIGVAVSSLVSTLTGSLYKSAIGDAADKIKEAVGISPEEPAKLEAISIVSGDAARDIASAGAGHDGTGDDVVPAVPAAHAGETGRHWETVIGKLERIGLIITFVTSIAAVMGTAFVIDAMTDGNGIGDKAPIVIVQQVPSRGNGAGGSGNLNGDGAGGDGIAASSANMTGTAGATGADGGDGSQADTGAAMDSPDGSAGGKAAGTSGTASDESKGGDGTTESDGSSGSDGSEAKDGKPSGSDSGNRDGSAGATAGTVPHATDGNGEDGDGSGGDGASDGGGGSGSEGGTGTGSSSSSGAQPNTGSGSTPSDGDDARGGSDDGTESNSGSVR
jgi:hypothetical protein